MQIIGIEPILFLIGSQAHHHLCVICINIVPPIGFEPKYFYHQTITSCQLDDGGLFVRAKGFEPSVFPCVRFTDVCNSTIVTAPPIKNHKLLIIFSSIVSETRTRNLNAPNVVIYQLIYHYIFMSKNQKKCPEVF